MTEAVIFDMDGTLVDTEPIHTEIERRQFKLNNLTISEEEHKKYLGTATDAMWIELAERYQMETPVELLVAQNHQECINYFSEIDRIPVMPGLEDLLISLWKKQLPMAVASSSTPEIIDLVLTKTGLKKYFQVIVSAQEAGKSKPEPDVFLLTARKLGISPENCLVVEDSKNGILAALNAGMTCIAFQYTSDSSPDHSAAKGVISHFGQLEAFL